MKAGAALLALVMLAPCPAFADRAGDICRKMLAEGRGGWLDEATCRCTFAVATEVLDPELLEMLADSWANGTNNLAAMDALPDQDRLARQFSRLQIELHNRCIGD